MNISQVQYVLAVARYGSFSEAALHLFLSQPALSLQVRNLEAELGYEIFARTSHGVSLTKNGEVFCEHARSVVDEWERFRQTVYPKSLLLKGRLRIGMGARVYSNRLFDDIVQFFENHPELEVTFFAESGQDFISGLRAGTLDLALDRLPPEALISEQSDITANELIREPQCILMAPDDPRRDLSGITFSDLEGCTMMTGLENSIEDRTLRNLCQAHGITLNRVYRSDSMETVMQLVRSGKGIIIGPQSFANYYGVAAVPLVSEGEVSLDFICLKQNAKRQDIQLFQKYITGVCRKRKEGTAV